MDIVISPPIPETVHPWLLILNPITQYPPENLRLRDPSCGRISRIGLPHDVQLSHRRGARVLFARLPPRRKPRYPPLHRRAVAGCRDLSPLLRRLPRNPTGQTFSFADGEVILSGDTYTRVLRHRASNIPLVTVQRKIGSPGGTIRSLIAEMPYTICTQVLWSAVDLPYTLLQYDTLTIHAAVIRFGSAAILFTAPSGTGKSTQAALWEKYRDAVVVNGDKGAISVHGGEIHAHGLPFCGTSGICSAYDLPVRAIVSLTQAPENTAVRLHGAAALQAVVQNSFGTKSLCFPKIIDLASAILEKVPVYRLSCTPDERAVDVLWQAIFR